MRSATIWTFSLGLICIALFTLEARLESEIEPGDGSHVDPSPVLLGSGGGRISWVDSDGTTEMLRYDGRVLEVFEHELYLLGDREITVIDLETGAQRNIPIPSAIEYVLNLTVLPDSSIALLDNQNDRVDFIDGSGDHLATVSISHGFDDHWQNLEGVVVDHRLILSEDGRQRLLAIDLDSYEVSVFRNLRHLRRRGRSYPLSALAYAEGSFYIGQGEKIYAFTEDSEGEELLTSLPDVSITSLVIVDAYIYAVVVRSKEVYRIERSSGKTTVLARDVGELWDLAFYPTSIP